MSQLQERIEQFRKMASDDPDNELGHYRLGQLLMEDKQYDQAVASFRRTLELSPHFSKVYQLLGQCLVAAGNRDEAIAVLKQGFDVADERGDKMPRDEMARDAGGTGRTGPGVEESQPRRRRLPDRAPASAASDRCAWPAFMPTSSPNRRSPTPSASASMPTICADCWNDWLRNYSIKVINELRLDLSTEHGQQEYDRYMSEFFGFEG